MCPSCLASSATVVASVTSLTGMAVLIAGLLPRVGTRRTFARRPATHEEPSMSQPQPRVASREDWLTARLALLEKEKAHTRAQDALAAERRRLPMVPVETEYTFDTPEGSRTLAQLFEGRSQLIVYHFMFGPGWTEGCPSCSMLVDHFDAPRVHLAARDVTLAVVSRATLPEIQRFKQRMGWRFPWASSNGTRFNRDFQVSFTPEEVASGTATYNFTPAGFPATEAHGISVFYKDAADRVYHTYSAYARGCEPFVGVYHLLDIAPRGRDEDELAFTMSWVRHHDRYGEKPVVDATAPYAPPPCACGTSAPA